MSIAKVIQRTIAAKNFDKAFYLVNIEDIINKHQRWLLKMPRIKPFYAVKCNSSPIVIQTLAALGLGFDCASKPEFEAVLSAGVNPLNTIYSNPCKAKSHIEFAVSKKADLMTFDNEDELFKIFECAPNARLVVRIEVDCSCLISPFKEKFGVSIQNVPSLLQAAKRLQLNVVGVSFHVGSTDSELYAKAIEKAAIVFNIASEIGFCFTLLDIGGGFSGKSDKKEILSFDDISKTVNTSIDKYFATETDLEIIAEPGRYYMSSAVALTTQIIGKRKHVVDDKTVMMYYVNDGIYSSFHAESRYAENPIVIPQINGRIAQKERSSYESIIYGQTMNHYDCILPEVVLPEMNVGEWITFGDMGSYSVALGTNFNGFEMPLFKYYTSDAALEYLDKKKRENNL